MEGKLAAAEKNIAAAREQLQGTEMRLAATEWKRDSANASIREWQARLVELTQQNERLAGNVTGLESELKSVKMQLAHKETGAG
jgi:chromosome segregation ATPase